ncbi:MAG: c-type cytochrome [Bryobacteraceae bacterium]|jgi:photosynthetic reaction center cytochrome c subunit
MLKTIFLTFAPAFSLLAQTPEVKTAEQVYKNITELKGIPADQLMPTMQFISTSLGVTCETCHVAGKFEADDKRPKKTAREMIAMEMAINKNSFHGQTQVTCYSCHRGSERPVNVPAVLETDAPAKPEERPTIARTPGTADSADAIIEKYVAAIGDMKTVTTRIGKGVIIVGGNETPIEVFTKAPNKRITISGGTSSTAFDGTIGWMGTAGRPAREMTPAESRSSALDAEFYLGLHLKEIFSELRKGRPEKIGDTEVVSLTGIRPSQPPVRFFFDAQSGLLLRMVRYTENPLGRMPVQVDYADYRAVDGVKTPFRWTLSRPNGRFTIQLKEVKANVPIDDAKFAKP